MQKVIINRGIPSSGKSTWAKEFIKENQDFKRVNKDDIRLMLANKSFMPTQEDLVHQIFLSVCMNVLKAGYSIIVDNTNLKQKYIEEINHLVEVYHYESGYQSKVTVEHKWFPIHLHHAIKYDSKRGRAKVGEKVIRRMYDNYVICGGPEPQERDVVVNLEYDSSLTDCIICDLDGTIADYSKNRGPFDATNCEKDDLIVPVAEVIKKFMYDKDSPTTIFFVSGREDKYEVPTIRFLNKYLLGNYSGLFMRKAGDKRKDYIIKREIYEKHIKGQYNVLAIFDDRPQVINECWKKLGLFVFNVGDGVDF